MTTDIWRDLDTDTVNDYLVTIQVKDDWVCFKDSQYAPETVSGHENRFNVDGQACYYAASGIVCAKSEVPNWCERDLYKIKSHTITAFDLPRYAQDNGCEEQFRQSKNNGGYKICQSLAQHLSTEVAVTGVLYNSYQSYEKGRTDLCLALFPESGCLVDDTYFVKDQVPPQNQV